MLIGAVCLAVTAVYGASAPPPGLYVRDGALMRAGKPFYGIGVNYFDCFARHLKDPQDTSYEQGFRQLKDRGIPFVRFMATGFWPVDMKLYTENPKEYFSRMDRVVKAAERLGIGLIPSLFWTLSTVPDLVGEPVNSWGDPSSKTHAWMRKYTSEVVRRYRRSPAIWGWELGNEYNLAADLPNAKDHRPPVWPTLGTPSSRSEKDEITHAMMRTALREFGKEVRKHDRERVIISGNSIPRPSAWHQQRELSWTKDTPEQFREMLKGDNPDPLDTLCIHAYAPEDTERLGHALAASREVRKPLFVGEFGVPGPQTADSERAFRTMLSQIVEMRVPFSALWVFDFAHQDREWNVRADNERAYQLDAVAEANRQLGALR